MAPHRTHTDTVRFPYSEPIPDDSSRAVVIMSGGDAVSPFTTPDHACGRGLAAGNTDTALREFLLAHGHQVFTAPAQNGRGVVRDTDPGSLSSFGDQPEVLGEQHTVSSDGDIDLAGHSNGGLFARSAIRTMTLPS